MFLTVAAKDLQPEDFCLGSRTRILGRPRADEQDSQRVQLKVQRKNGKVGYVIWNARTTIGIERTDA